MRLLHAILLTGILLAAPVGASGYLEISPDGRHLQDGDGRPFLITGDSAWSLMAGPTLEEAQLYLQDRADRGFNFIVATLMEHKFATNAPANANGDLPFTGKALVTPNEAYFAHVDAIVDFAASLDIVLMLAPIYIGYNCGDQGWCQEMHAATLEEMRDWGRYVGARYAGYENIMWSIGGDADPSQVEDKVLEFVIGLREFDTRNLITAHGDRGTQAVTYWPAANWLQVNNVFAYASALYQYTRDAYSHSPVMPFFLLEGMYENEHGIEPEQLRAQNYWTVLTGGFGVVFGNCPIWHFGYASFWCGLTDWQAQLGGQGSVQMTHYRALFESRRWEQLSPDVDHTVLTSGFGTDGSEDYATAAAAADGSSIIAYVPTPRATEFDTGVLTGSTVRAWWFDPVDGSSGLIGDFAPGIVQIPAWASGDRVLVLDDAAQNFGAPGTPLPTATTPADPRRSRLEQNQPNPFNPSTTIRFELAHASSVDLSIFDAAGRVVRKLLGERRQAGPHSIRWDGRDDHGQRLGSGVYYYRLQTADGVETRKMVLLE